MRKILKYPLKMGIQNKIDMPFGSVVVHTAVMNEQPSIWVITDSRMDIVSREFIILGTGIEIPDHYSYTGTAFQHPYVWHVFERHRTT